MPHVIHFKIDRKLEFVDRDKFNFSPDIFEKGPKSDFIEIKSSETISLNPTSICLIKVNISKSELELPFKNESKEKFEIKKDDSLGHCVMVSEKDLPKISTNKEPVTTEEIIIYESRSSEEKNVLLELINKYRQTVARDVSEIGRTRLLKMEIVEKPGTEPPFAKSYRSGEEERLNLEELVKSYKSVGLATETDSPYASPCFLVKKSDGSHRLVVHYRRLNKNTVRLNFPIPNLGDEIESLNGAVLFTTLDLAHGYMQIPLTENAKQKTSFITQDETGQFERAMFGLINAPFYFNKLMKIIFGPYGNSLELTYFDDILIHAKSWKEMLEKI